MIVVERGGRVLLITQLDHAALAGRFGGEWGNDGFEAPEPRASVILAASRHDEGWREWDDELRQDPEKGGPLYFLDVEIEDYVRLYGRGIERIAGLDPYAGLLVSLHGTGNVCGRWGVQRGIRLSKYDEAAWPPVIRRYVLEQEALQSRLKLDLLGLNPEERRSRFERRLWANFELLQAWDRLSLHLCRADPAAGSEADLGAVPTRLDGCSESALRVRAGEGRATVSPWPFRTAALEVEVPVQGAEPPIRWTLHAEAA